MTPRRLKGCFDNVAKLRQHNPEVFCRFLDHFPLILNKFGIALPPSHDPEAIPYGDLCNALMSPDLPSHFVVLLILIGKLDNEQGWREIEYEAKLRRVDLSFSMDGLSYADRAMMAWIVAQPGHPDILEEAFARARIYAKSSYTYYPMTFDFREHFATPDKEAISALEVSLDHYFSEMEKLGKGAKVLVYDYDAEIWFLVRHPGIVKREGVYQGDKTTSLALTPELYDAVVYHKKYGDLRMNTHRQREHTRYRIDFGHLLFSKENVFDPNKRIVRLDPLKNDCVDLCKTDDIPGLFKIAVAEVCFYSLSAVGKRVTWRAETTKGGLPFDASNHVIPEDTDTIQYAKFRYQLSAEPGKWRCLIVHTGKNLNYERDGDSCVLENWLRKRGFIDGWAT